MVDTLRFSMGQEVSNEQLLREFGGSPFRALRVSEEKRTIVLLANYNNEYYVKKWRGNLFYFSAFTHQGRGQHGLHYYPNSRLYNAKSEGFRVLLFERYPLRRNYIFSGEVEVRGLVDHSLMPELLGEQCREFFFLLSPIRHRIQEENPKIIDLKVEIRNDEKYWQQFLLAQSLPLNLDRTNVGKYQIVVDSLWRLYASLMVEAFLLKVESDAPNLRIPEYDLERGSIKSVLPILAAVAGIAGGTMSATANYPKAKEALPVIRTDAERAIKKAIEALENRFPGLMVYLVSEEPKAPHRKVDESVFGPPLTRRKEEVDLKVISSKDQ